MPTLTDAVNTLVSNTTTLQTTVSGRITDMDGKITQANTAKVAAETAKAAAEIAKGLADTAKTDAETAQTLAENAKTAAETAQGIAATAKTDALVAKAATDTAKGNAESAQTAAESARTDAQQWATKTDGAVSGGEYSAKYHATAASTSASTAASTLADRYTKAETDAKVVELSPPATKAHVDSLGINAATLTGSLPAISGANLTGIETVTKAASNPLVTTNGSLGDQGINTTTGEMFILKDATTNSNAWQGQDGSTVRITKGLTSANYATGAQEVADTGGTTGVYYINNYTTGNTTQQVYCWIGVNGDNWQKFNVYGNHMGSNHGHVTKSCTGSLTDNFSATAADYTGDYTKWTGTSGCGGISTNTTGLFGNKQLSTYSEAIKIMATTYRHNIGGQFQVHLYMQADDSAPTGYNDGGSSSTDFWNGYNLPAGQRGLGIVSISAWSGSSMTFTGQSWHGGNSVVPSNYELTSNSTTAPSGEQQNRTATSTSGSHKLYLKINAWSDYAPNDAFDFNTWITT